jgi:O-antigen/teichoic acid export membrane protein
MLSVARGVLRGVQHFGHLNANNILEAAFRLTAGILLLAIAVNAAMAVAAYAVAVALALAFSPWQMRSAWAGHEAQPLDGRAIRKLAGPLLLMTVAVAGFNNIDMLFAKRSLAATDAGVYGAATTLSRMISVLVTPFTTLMLPVLTTLYERGRSTTPAFLRICGYFLVLVAAPVAVCCAWPEWIMVTFYDKRFAGGGAVLTCLVLGRLMGYLAHMLCLLFAARNTFGYLYFFLPAMLAMVVALALWHETPLMTATVVLISETATLGGMVVYLWTKRKRKRPSASEA